MNISLIHSIWTVLLFITFIGIVLWAWSGKRRKRFEQAARMALEEDDEVMHGGDTQHG